MIILLQLKDYSNRGDKMLTFKLISIIDGFYHYEIYPEGKTEKKQTIIFNPETEELKKTTFDDSNMKYLGHFLQSVTDADGNYLEKGMSAWG